MSNEDSVRAAYAAFGRGDLPAILDGLTDDVKWKMHATFPADFPYPAVANGRAAVESWFHGLLGSTEFISFEPKWFVSGGDRVVAGGWWEAKSRSTSGTVASDWVHVWTFDTAGKASGFDDFLDSGALIAAHAPVGAA